jgi:hypothetical protein
LVTMKLGELLIQAGKITPAQLEETLKGQAIFGGKFGTNLIEMGYLDEHDLAHFLSKKTGLPHASPEELMNVPPQVIRLIPEEMVKKYRVVPVALNNRKLSLAMSDPMDFSAIDEISFVTGFIVIPLITPDLRLICALEKYYNIKREMRYIPVAGGGRNRGQATQAPVAPPVQAVPSKPVPSRPAPIELDDSDIFELPLLDEFECFGDMGEAEPQQPQQAAQAQAQPQPAAQAQAQAPVSLAGGALLQEAEPDFSLEGVLRGLAQAHDRHSIADLVVGYAGQQFNRSALFLLKGDKATGWVAQVGKKPLPGFDELEIPLNEPSVLKVVAESKSFYLGPMPISHWNNRIIAALGGGTPMTHLLVPLMMMGRVVAILYVEGGITHMDEQVLELQKLLGKGSMAFEILILKSKILLT